VAKPPIAVRPMKSSANGVNPAMPSDVSKPALRARMYGKPLRLIPEPPSALVTRPRRRFATEGKPARGTAAESAVAPGATRERAESAAEEDAGTAANIANGEGRRERGEECASGRGMRGWCFFAANGDVSAREGSIFLPSSEPPSVSKRAGSRSTAGVFTETSTAKQDRFEAKSSRALAPSAGQQSSRCLGLCAVRC